MTFVKGVTDATGRTQSTLVHYIDGRPVGLMLLNLSRVDGRHFLSDATFALLDERQNEQLKIDMRQSGIRPAPAAPASRAVGNSPDALAPSFLYDVEDIESPGEWDDGGPCWDLFKLTVTSVNIAIAAGTHAATLIANCFSMPPDVNACQEMDEAGARAEELAGYAVDMVTTYYNECMPWATPPPEDPGGHVIYSSGGGGETGEPKCYAVYQWVIDSNGYREWYIGSYCESDDGGEHEWET